MKVAMITGATRGIGLAITKKLIEDGYKISALGTRNVEDYDEFSEIYKKGNILFTKGDVSNKYDRQIFVRNSYEKYGHVNLLINNAGVAPKIREDILKLSEESLDRLIKINAKSCLFLTQLVSTRMIQDTDRDKAIINIASISSEVVSVERAEYCLSKACISMITKLFAVRLAEFGINVYEIRPGIIKTDMTKTVENKYNQLFESGECPIKRWGYPEDVANVVSALAEFKFKYTTGEVINVDGGYTIPRL
ncbi:MAG: 3-ketoacyl-ACP reductase [Helcococcus sp.]|nr:3-ketoacyl-ACP reductase [Helcococcus sp.]